MTIAADLFAIAGVIAAGIPAFLVRYRLPTFILPLILLFLIPGLVVAWMLARDPATAMIPARAFWEGVLIAPACFLPLIIKLRHIDPQLARTGAGLGAGPSARLRLIWLPLLGPSAGVTTLLTALLIVLLHWVRI
ncbi:hypothetical protein AA101099_2936 [Neoasaia chiangmaiensis NBRC 101099]|uniref:Uncharacterized protein n=1 Tax=Neoasaia chiangmaiensis TaxID=320497 RepID=A0A1U9KP46_9PROT|nr:hypothetical protein [Neoasaia chiangmaiensis]AQS87460.1 hypothetical protein A0U93_05345 [Neoasaia chiangmaiensis]GBR42638.1 hypothetical protein AA101099_2936 [Neoasaia chiangmaiensis NBRC 101099]GEN16243.1 hypothetical protein NCH01_26740 [Neoasaia chiangmaiensis]